MKDEDLVANLMVSPAGGSPALPAPAGRRLTAAQFQQLATVPAAVEWFASINNPRTRRAYRGDIEDFCAFVGLAGADEFRLVTRAHVLAWRAQLEQRALSTATIRRKLAALSSLFDYLLEQNAVAGGNPANGVRRPRVESNEGKTPALSDDQARRLLAAPGHATVKGLRDSALLAVLLYHGLRRAEAAKLGSGDLQERRGIMHLRVQGKGGKIRYLPLHAAAAELIYQYLERDKHRPPGPGPLFRALRGRAKGSGITADGIYQVVAHWAQVVGIEVAGLGVHGLRVTAVTNALENGADIVKLQAWLGHDDISTTRKYDRRAHRTEDSPTYRVRY